MARFTRSLRVRRLGIRCHGYGPGIGSGRFKIDLRDPETALQSLQYWVPQ